MVLGLRWVGRDSSLPPPLPATSPPHPLSSSCREAQKPPPPSCMWSLAPPCGPRPDPRCSAGRAPLQEPPTPPPPNLPPPTPGLTASSAYPPFPVPRISAHFLNPQIPPCPALGEVLTQSGGPGTDGASATVPAAHWSVGGAAARGLELSSATECWRPRGGELGTWPLRWAQLCRTPGRLSLPSTTPPCSPRLREPFQLLGDRWPSS